jgi:glycosyltransferase involved in cell wall biosynthesis
MAVNAAAAPAFARPPTIGIVSQSSIADDPRVRRQGDALRAAGWDVIGIGLAGARAAQPDWPILTSDDVTELPERPRMPVTGYRSRGWRGAMIRALGARQPWGLTEYERRLLSVWIDRRRAETVYWTLNSVLWDLLALGASRPVDMWLGNDWTSLPIVARLARQQRVPYAYDTHELAADEFNENRRWRYVERPIRIAIEGQFIRDAAVVSTVSSGIAARLRDLHGLAATPLVVRSTPHFQPAAPRQSGERIRVLYHGAVWQHRGLEASIRSVAGWRPEFDLTIRGPVSEEYRAQLEREIDAAGVRGRVQIVPPVPMVNLVREAAAFDIGLFALPGHSRHNRYALPNKFFEYTMAGLALCISDLPEMAGLLRQYDLGRLIPAVEPQAIAAAINSFDRTAIAAYKRNALAAAQELNWERESEKMVDRYSAIVTAAR